MLTATGSASALHDRPMPTTASAELWRLVPTAPAIVLGSRQQADRVRPQAGSEAEFEVANRSSGGGAVVVDPDATLWVDVLIPRDGPLWSDDLGRTFLDVGERWQRALAGLGLATEMWQSRPAAQTADIGAVACFAGVGWGELLLDGQKVVGLSQRRTRWGARVQCLYDPQGCQRVLVDGLVLADSDRRRLAEIFLPTMSEMPAIDAVWAAIVSQFDVRDG